MAPSSALAQKKKNAGVPTNEGPKGQSYVLSYFLAALTIGLGLAIVCRPSGRQQPPNPLQPPGG